MKLFIFFNYCLVNLFEFIKLLLNINIIIESLFYRYLSLSSLKII